LPRPPRHLIPDVDPQATSGKFPYISNVTPDFLCSSTPFSSI
jgi:hypothetical protein